RLQSRLTPLHGESAGISDSGMAQTRLTTIEALVPPKPKLLASAARTGFRTAVLGMKFSPVAAQRGSTFSKLMVGGITPSRTASTAAKRPIAPAPPRR